jgi:glyoxylase-like metal-dependent hydrolase (beta-lactamase superfamily II)
MTDEKPPYRLAPGVWHIDLTGVNAYLVDDGTLTLVDAGTPWDGRSVKRQIAATGRDYRDVDRVLVTHYDLDHVGGLAALDLDVPHYVGEPDASYLDGSARPPLPNRKGAFQRLAAILLDPPDVPIRRVADGDEVGEFRAFATPGHTPGHVAYVHPGRDVGLLGDLVRGLGDRLGPPPLPMTADPGRNRESVRSLAARALPFEVAAMGHGTPLREGGADALADLANRG